MKTTGILLFLVFIVPGNMFSQVTFEKTYPSSLNNEFVYKSQLLLLPDSGYIFTTTEYTNNHDSLFIGRLDKTGNVEWVKQVGDGFEIYGINATLSQTGSLFITYSTEPTSIGYYCSVVLKMDTNGTL